MPSNSDVDRIMRMSDAEVLAHARSQGFDPAEIATKMSAAFEQLVAEHPAPPYEYSYSGKSLSTVLLEIACSETDDDRLRALHDAADLASQSAPVPMAGEPVAYMAHCEKTGGRDVETADMKHFLIERANANYREHGYVLVPLYASPAPSDDVIEAFQMARTRLENFADDANAGNVHYSARELKRKIWAAFADVEALLPPHPQRIRNGAKQPC
jgi:hypothetical protein